MHREELPTPDLPPTCTELTFGLLEYILYVSSGAGKRGRTEIAVREAPMKSSPNAPEESPRPPRSDSIRVYLPGGVPVLRIAVEDLLNSGWDEVFQQRACEIACAFEGSFKSCGRADLATITHSILALLELDRGKARYLDLALRVKLTELLGRLENLIGSDEEMRTA
jgi:hypothetical protein